MAVIDQYLQQILEAKYGEEVRHSIHDAIKQNYIDITESVDRANAAAAAANQASQNVSAAVDTANQAAEAANQAVQDVNAVADTANQAAEAANQAKEAANQATETANRATETANQAAQNANAVADTANAAAESANQATESANQATESTSQATAAANQATEAANQATEAANQAAQSVSATIDTANKATEDANQATAAANQAASTANTASKRATDAAILVEGIEQDYENATAEATAVQPGGSPTVALTDGPNGKKFVFGLPTGATPQISIGTVSTGAAGSNAEVNISGSADAPVLNFTIPMGDTGETPTVYGNTVPMSESDSTSIAQVITDLKSAFNTLQPAATAQDVGKALIVKTVDQTTGKPSAYEYGEAGGGGDTSNCAPVIINTASGAIASFDDGADGMPMKKLVANIEPVQEGSGDPSPDNVRPISGFTGLTIRSGGKNLFDISAYTKKSDTVSVANGVISFSAAWGYAEYNINVNNSIPLTMSADMVVTSSNYIQMQIKNNEATQGSHNFNSTGRGSYSFSLKSGYIIRFTASSGDCSISRIQIEVGTVGSAYQPFTQASAIPISWQSEAGTVYGGTLDVVSGTLTVNMFKYRVPRLTENMISIDQNYIKSDACDGYIKLNPVPYPACSPWSLNKNNVCSAFNIIKDSIWARTGYVNSFTINSDQLHLNIANDLLGIVDYTQETVGSAKTKMANYLNSLYDAGAYVEVTYTIQPTVYTLTQQEVRTLLGTNNIWADTGDVEVTYPADTKLYIDNKITQAIANALNS